MQPSSHASGQDASSVVLQLAQPALLVEGETVIAISPETEAIWGTWHGNFEPTPLSDLVGQPVARQILGADPDVPSSFPLTLKHANGMVRPAIATRMSMPQPNCFALLITVKQRSLLDIISEEYRSLIDTVPDLILVQDQLGTIVFANDTASQFLGISVEQLVGSNVMDLLSPEEAVAAQQRGKARNEGGEGKFFGYQLRRVTQDGAAIELDIRSMPFWEDSSRELILVIGKNTGEDVIRQERLDSARLRAEADSASKSAALAQASHEIRTPLNIVFGMIDMAMDDELPEDTREYLTMARSAARTLLSLLDDFLEFSKLDAGKLQLREAPFSPVGILSEACAGMKLVAQEKNLEFELILDENLPQHLYGDAGRLRQIVGNLTTNAIKYTEKGNVRVTADLARIEDQACYLHLRIADTGCGISPQALPYLFQPFHQLDENAEGSGLGLAIVKELVELLGGRVWVESVEGRGSEFHFTAVFQLQAEAA